MVYYSRLCRDSSSCFQEGCGRDLYQQVLGSQEVCPCLKEIPRHHRKKKPSFKLSKNSITELQLTMLGGHGRGCPRHHPA